MFLVQRMKLAVHYENIAIDNTVKVDLLSEYLVNCSKYANILPVTLRIYITDLKI